MKTLFKNIWLRIEEPLVFHPLRKTLAEPTEKIKHKIENLYIKSGNSTLNAWYLHPKGNNPVVIYCHGQGENISSMQQSYDFMEERGIGFLAVDYTGHGNSTGHPTEEKIYSDIDTCVEYLKNEKHFDMSKIIIWGRSMGGAIAIEASTRHSFLGTIVESSFTNIKDAGVSLSYSNHEAMGPIRRILFRNAHYMPVTQNFDSYSKIDRVKSPMLIIHSKHDELINFEQAQKNARKADFAKFVLLDEGGHYYSSWAFDEIEKFINQLSRVEVSQPL